MPRNAQASATPSSDTPARKGGGLHHDAVVELRKMIVAGEIPPGERLREVAISERLGMSRTPVREAFRTLAAEGLVHLLPNRSVVVSEPDPTESADVFALLGALEAVAARQACERMTQPQIDRLGELQDEMVRAFEANDRASYSEANRLVHELIVEGSHNVSLMLAWRMILPRADRARRLNTLDREEWARFLAVHQQMLDALTARNSAALAQLMRQHFDHAVESMTKRIRASRKASRSAAPL